MKLEHIATRNGRLSTFLRQELGLSTGLMNKLKWSEKLYVNGFPRHADFSVQTGDVITADRLVEAMLLPSGNDAAYLLAEQAGRVIAGGETPDQSISASTAVDLFMKEMNEQANRLGMDGTHFVNPDGIHKENHYTNYQDLAKMAQLALENPTILKYASKNIDYVTFASGEERKWENTNDLINPESPYYCPYAVGLKTGQTPGAGACLLSAFKYQSKTLIIGTFGCPGVEDRFIDTLQLFNKAIGIAQ